MSVSNKCGYAVTISMMVLVCVSIILRLCKDDPFSAYNMSGLILHVMLLAALAVALWIKRAETVRDE